MYTAIVLCVLLIQLFYCVNRYRYFLTPPILLTSIWLLVHAFNLLLGWQTEEVEYLILAIPPIMFGFGFTLLTRYKICFGKARSSTNGKYSNEFIIKNNILYVILVIDILLMFWSLREANTVISSLTNANYWLNVHESASLVESNFLLSYSIPAAYVFSGICGLIYSKEKSIRMLFVYILAIVVAIIRAFMAGNRTALFMVIIINLFPMLLSIKENVGFNDVIVKRKTRRLVLLAVLVTTITFFGIASQKYVDQFSSLPIIDFIIRNFTGYFNLSSAAFVKWYKQGVVHTNGANTFRFIYAVLNRVGITVPVADINAQFISVEGTVTNAFTVAKVYVEDYGIVFMAFMLFVFGVIHAHFYKKAFSNDIQKRVTGQLFCGALYIGLLNQIMSDQYVSIMSMMISFYIWSYIFPKLLIRKVDNTD